MSKKQFHTLRVTEIIPETENAVSLTFAIPEELKKNFEYIQGQFLTLKFKIDEKEVHRSYSMCSSPLEDCLSITVKRVKKGLVSNYINDDVKVGLHIEVMPPDGRFFTNLDEKNSKTYYLFGAGSGITPLMSTLKTILGKEPQSTVFLLYGNRNESSIIFKDELGKLEKRYTGRLKVEHILSQPKREKGKGLTAVFGKGKTNWDGKIGRIDAKQVVQFLQENPAHNKLMEYFICGPGTFIDTVKAALIANGIDEKHIHAERFSTTPVGEEEKVKGVEGAKIKVTLDDEEFEVVIASGKTILDTLLDLGHDPPYSCTSGACATCMAKILKGSVKMDACYALDEDEIANGYILTCQSHPTSEEVVLTYDV